MPKQTTQIQAPKPLLCPKCNHAPFGSKQALNSHDYYKHKNQPIAELPPPQESDKETKESLLAEIERLKKEIPEIRAQIEPPKPKTYQPLERKKPPWVVQNSIPAKQISVQELTDDKKMQDAIINQLNNAKPLATRAPIEYSASQPTKVEFKQGSWADIYKEDLLVRMIPFIWQQDKETKQNWAIMLEQDFYGKPRGRFQLSYPLLILGFDKSRNFVDYYGRGFKIAVDEVSQLQIPIHELDDDEKLHKRLDDNSFNSQNMALYRELIIHAKKKWNWTLIIIIILILVGVGVFAYYIYTHPHFLSNLFGNL